jgi:hypothetical protein
VFVTEAIRHAVTLGHGIGPVNPGWRAAAAADGQDAGGRLDAAEEA